MPGSVASGTLCITVVLATGDLLATSSGENVLLLYNSY
jgi:hypothetical protein